MPRALASNPFATRFTRPGTIEFLFQAEESLESLVGKLREHGWWGQIIGPHGSGKSTLLAALEPKLVEAGREVVRRSLAGGQRHVDLPSQLAPTAILVIDGFEQLSWWSRWKIKAVCRRMVGAGLLVTAHADLGLPTIFATQPSLELTRRLVSRLLPEDDATLTDADVAAAFSRHPDNLREMLFYLYDLYQARGAGTLGRQP